MELDEFSKLNKHLFEIILIIFRFA